LRTEVGEHLLAVEDVAEEEPQQAFVADLEDGAAGARQPVVERLLAGRRKRVFRPPEPPARLVAPLDETRLAQPAELRIDLPEARAPEEAGRRVDRLLDVVPGAEAEAEHAEDHARSRTEA
jgi:hypothetical protein